MSHPLLDRSVLRFAFREYVEPPIPGEFHGVWTRE